jgi:octaprenyl-diphosphate synthase
VSDPPTLDAAFDFLRADLERVERTMLEGMCSIAPLIPQIAEYTFGSGGKRIRPLLVLLGARLFDYTGPRAIQIAAVAEWLHSASLLHDDVVDGAPTRRGRPVAAVHFGPRQAILVGDFIYATLCRVLVEDGSRELLLRYSQSISDMAEGEVLQLGRSFQPDIDEATYLQVIGRKTSSLLATAVESGAILGDAKPDERAAVREYGWQLGLAYQLADDALDYSGTQEELGKAPLTDLREGKITMPLLHALRAAAGGERESIVDAIKSLSLDAAAGRAPDVEMLDRVSGSVARHGGVETTLARAQHCIDAACSQLAGFAEGPAKRALDALACFVVERRN